MFWRIVKCWRRARIMLGIYADKGKSEHFLFQLSAPITAHGFYEKVIPLHYELIWETPEYILCTQSVG